MNLRETIRRIIRSNPVTDNVVTRSRLFNEIWYHYCRFCRSTGQIGMEKKESKFAADLRIRVHAIEKGLSMPHPRVSFGEKKVKDILQRVDYYKSHFGNTDFLSETKAILDCYFKFNADNNHTNEQLQARYSQLLTDINGGGTKEVLIL